eukprot:scaffold188571_cov36-Tisochrysis_lutea.AAC.1
MDMGRPPETEQKGTRGGAERGVRERQGRCRRDGKYGARARGLGPVNFSKYGQIPNTDVSALRANTLQIHSRTITQGALQIQPNTY